MKLLPLILGMTAVTFIPRLLPLVSLADYPLPPFWKRFLSFIPFTALGALIIPGVFQAVPGKPLAALAGMGAALGCAWFKNNLIWAVFAAVLVTYVVLRFT